MEVKNKRFSADRLTEIMLFLILVVCFAYTFPRWADPNQNSRLDMVFAVVEDGTFRIDNYVANTVDYAKVGSHYYSDKAPGTAFIGIPVYAGLRVFLDFPVINPIMDRLSNNAAFQSTLNTEGTGILEQKVRFAIAQIVITFVVAVIPTSLLGVLLYRFSRKLGAVQWVALAVVLVYALLTPAFAYAGALYGHQLSAFLLFLVFYLLFVNEQISGWKMFLLGLALGYAVVTEYPVVLIVLTLYVYAFYKLARAGKWLQIGWLTLGGGVVAAGWMAYNTYIFGGPLTLGYSYSELWVDEHSTGFMSLTLPHWAASWGITFSGFRGLFYISPILLLALPGFVLWWRKAVHRAAFVVVLLVSLEMFFFNASSIMWWGGFAIGPRYLLPMLPFFTLPLAFTLQAWGDKLWLRVSGVVLALWSLVVTWGLTLAGQAFPSDVIQNPFTEYALVHWGAGNIARNLGTILGFSGAASLVPLGLVLVVLVCLWVGLARRQTGIKISQQVEEPSSTL
jgi:hypothetical protein